MGVTPVQVKHCCENCYFLWFFQDLPVNPIYSPVPSDRRADYLWMSEKTAVCCHKGVWIQDRPSRDPEVFQYNLSQNRKDSCFFVEHKDGMSADAADELQRRLHENRQFKKSIQYTQWGLAVSAAGLVISGIVMLIELLYQVISDIINFLS